MPFVCVWTNDFMPEIALEIIMWIDDILEQISNLGKSEKTFGRELFGWIHSDQHFSFKSPSRIYLCKKDVHIFR